MANKESKRPRRVPRRQVAMIKRDVQRVERLFDLVSKDKAKAELFNHF